MKRYLVRIISVLIIACGILTTGCNNSSKVDSNKEIDSNEKADSKEKENTNLDNNSNEKSDSDKNIKKLSDSLALTNTANSLEGDMITNIKEGNQSIDIKINLKLEDIKKDMKGKLAKDEAGKHQEYYIKFNNGKVDIYTEESAGKYSIKTTDSSKIPQANVANSFNAYIEIIEKNPDMVKAIGENTYTLTIPKEKTAELYSKITGVTEYTYESFVIEFIIGKDGYLQEVNLNASAGSFSIKENTKYFNYDKKFNIAIPRVSK